MIRHITVDENGIVQSVTNCPTPIVAENVIQIDNSISASPGLLWTGTECIEPPAAVYSYTLHVTHVDAALVNDELSEVTCKVGDCITVKARLADSDGNTVPLSDSFRMPIRTRDGKEEVYLLTLKDGMAELNMAMDTSGVWQVTQDDINETLPAERQMGFNGIQIFVCK